MVSELTPFLQFTPGGLLGVVVVMMMFGYLIPVRIVRGRLADKDIVIAELRRSNEVLLQNNARLLAGNTAAVQVLEALPEVVGGDSNAEVV